jgi:very-short-patch-repair endonuclease
MPEDLDITQPFTTRQALAAGLTPGQLRGPEFHQVMKGVHLSAKAPITELQRIRAALLVHPDTAFASHFCAAEVYGIPVPAHDQRHVSVFHLDDRRRRPEVRCHLAQPDTRILTVKGMRVPSPAQVFVQLARYLTFVDLVVAGDYIVRRGWCTPEQLVAFCAASTDAHADRALEAARYVRDGVDSPMETRLRMLLVLAGLPEPTVNLKIRDAMGDVLRRYDLSYPEVRVIVEYDGRQHVEIVEQWDSDVDRREEIDDQDWRIIVVLSKGIFREPERTLQRVARVLRKRGMPGVPARFDERWRAHFPGQGALR